MANLTTLLYPVSAAVTNIPNPISAVVTNTVSVSSPRLDTINIHLSGIKNDTFYINPKNFTGSTVGTNGNYVNQATYTGSLYKAYGYNGSNTDDYLQIFAGTPTAFDSIYFSGVIKAKQNFEFTFSPGMINGQFTICNSLTPRNYVPGEPVLLLNILYYQY